MTTATVIRASSLNAYADCPRRAAASILRAEIEDAGYRLTRSGRSVGALVGTATHAGAAAILTDMIAGEPPRLNSAHEDAAMAAWTEGLADDDEGALHLDATTKTVREGEVQVRALVGRYAAEVAPAKEPVAVERRLEARLGSLVLSGQADLIIANGGPDDLKTGARYPNAMPQVGAYVLLARAHRLLGKHAGLDWLPRPRGTAKPYERIELDADHAADVAMAALARIEGDIGRFREAVAAGSPSPELTFPANPSSMLCGPKYCAAHGTDYCREHRKELA